MLRKRISGEKYVHCRKVQQVKTQRKTIPGSSRPIDTSATTTVHKTQETWMKKARKSVRARGSENFLWDCSF